jgi:hypothetical protein
MSKEIYLPENIRVLKCEIPYFGKLKNEGDVAFISHVYRNRGKYSIVVQEAFSEKRWDVPCSKMTEEEYVLTLICINRLLLDFVSPFGNVFFIEKYNLFMRIKGVFERFFVEDGGCGVLNKIAFNGISEVSNKCEDINVKYQNGSVFNLERLTAEELKKVLAFVYCNINSSTHNIDRWDDKADFALHYKTGKRTR